MGGAYPEPGLVFKSVTSALDWWMEGHLEEPCGADIIESGLSWRALLTTHDREKYLLVGIPAGESSVLFTGWRKIEDAQDDMLVKEEDTNERKSMAFKTMRNFTIGIDAEGVEWKRLQALHFPNVEAACRWFCDFQDIPGYDSCDRYHTVFDEGEIKGVVATLTTPSGEKYAVRCVHADPSGTRLVGWRKIDG